MYSNNSQFHTVGNKIDFQTKSDKNRDTCWHDLSKKQNPLEPNSNLIAGTKLSHADKQKKAATNKPGPLFRKLEKNDTIRRLKIYSTEAEEIILESNQISQIELRSQNQTGHALSSATFPAPPPPP